MKIFYKMIGFINFDSSRREISCLSCKVMKLADMPSCLGGGDKG
jgi:hypothetical protein